MLSGIGMLFQSDRRAARREVVAAIHRNDGVMVRVAHDLGLERRYFYKVLYREQLWPEVDKARAAARERKRNPDWLTRTRAALRKKRK